MAFGIIGPLCLQAGEFPAKYGLSEAAKGWIVKQTLYWPAIFVVLVASLVNLALEYKAFDGLIGFDKGMFDGFKSKDGQERVGFIEKNKREIYEMLKKRPDEYQDRSNEQTPFVVWFGGCLFLMVLTFFVYTFYFADFGVQAWHVLIAMFLCIFLALVYLQILGKTNWGLISIMVGVNVNKREKLSFS